jgi:chromosomal replication initiator protein
MNAIDMNAFWSGVKQSLHERIQPEQFELWVSPTQLVEMSDNRLCVAVPDDLHAAYLENNLASQMQDAVEAATGKRRPIQFSVDHAAAQMKQAELFPDQYAQATPPSSVRKSTQRPLPAVGAINQNYTFDSFVVGASNEFAAAACRAVANNPAKAYNPIFLCGNTGLGKTHLMHAIAAEILQQRPKAKIICVNCEEFINDFIAAIQHNTLPEFRKRYRHADVLLIDDVHFLAGKERSQEEFFYTFNRFHDGHKQIVLTSDRMPNEIKNLEKRLVSRFEWGMTAALAAPDVETRMAILRKKLQILNAPPIPEEIVRFVAERVKSNVRRLEGAIVRVVSYFSLNRERPLSVQTVADEILHDFLHEEAKTGVTPDKIQKHVADYYDLRVQDLLGSRRTAQIAWARQVAMHLTRTLTKISYQDVGEAFGGRDHGTVIHAVKKVEQRMAKEESIATEIKYLLKELQR